MADDGLRPTPGNPPEQRHEAPPGWWGALGREDLPDDMGRPSAQWIEFPPVTLSDPFEEPRGRLRVWAATTIVVLALVAMVAVVLTLTPAHDVVPAMALFAIPTLLGGLATIVALHRGGS